MKRASLIFCGAASALVVAIACSSSALKYPACEQDSQCAVGAKHDYCIDGKCVYCRSSTDCGDRERCRAGQCELDPNAPPKLDGGEDASDAEADADEEAEPSDDDDTPHASQHGRPPPSRIIPRGVRRILHP